VGISKDTSWAVGLITMPKFHSKFINILVLVHFSMLSCYPTDSDNWSKTVEPGVRSLNNSRRNRRRG
jgi:hypothetical protein